jgi:hypothetical protein
LLAALLLVFAACSGEPSLPVQEVKDAIETQIRADGGELRTRDPRSGALLELRFDHVHDTVTGTPGGRFIACVDFVDASGVGYDVDYYVDRAEAGYAVEDVALHEVDGQGVLPDERRLQLEQEP